MPPAFHCNLCYLPRSPTFAGDLIFWFLGPTFYIFMLIPGAKYHQCRLAQFSFLWANDDWRCAVLLLLAAELHTQAAVRQDAEMSCTHENEQVLNQNSTGCWAVWVPDLWSLSVTVPVSSPAPSLAANIIPTQHFQKRTAKIMHLFFVLIYCGKCL